MLTFALLHPTYVLEGEIGCIKVVAKPFEIDDRHRIRRAPYYFGMSAVAQA